MKIAILGTGFVGKALGRRMGQLGHEVVFGSRTPDSEAAQAIVAENPERLSVATQADAANQCETIIFAVPWPVAEETIRAAGDLNGKTLIDCTNPLNERFDDIELGYTESAAERIAEWAVGAHVVKAFNTVGARTMDDPNFDGQSASVFYCGDDASAMETTRALLEILGFDAIDSGNLRAARYLEPMAMLCIQLAVHKKVEGECALRILRR